MVPMPAEGQVSELARPLSITSRVPWHWIHPVSFEAPLTSGWLAFVNEHEIRHCLLRLDLECRTEVSAVIELIDLVFVAFMTHVRRYERGDRDANVFVILDVGDHER
jgi:hypothetical protein